MPGRFARLWHGGESGPGLLLLPPPPRFLLRAVLVLSPVAGLSHGHCLTEIAADLPRAPSQAVPADPGGWLVWFEAPFTPLLPWVLLCQEP